MKKLFLILTAGLFALAACEPTNEPQGGDKPQGGNTEEQKGTLTVVEKSVEIAFYGGNGTINYTITDGEEGAKPAVVANQEWVSNITVADKITFDVAMNDTAEQLTQSVARPMLIFVSILATRSSCNNFS